MSLVWVQMNSIFNNKEFLRPLLTPYELEAALVPQEIKGEWDGGYDLDFRNLLRDKSVDAWAKGCVAQQEAAANQNARQAKAVVTVGGREVSTFVSPAAERLSRRECARQFTDLYSSHGILVYGPAGLDSHLLWTYCVHCVGVWLCVQGKDLTRALLPMHRPP